MTICSTNGGRRGVQTTSRRERFQMKPPLERNVKMQIPPRGAESPRFPNVSISQGTTAGPFQPCRSWELHEHPAETSLPSGAPKGANLPGQDPAGPIPGGSLPTGTRSSSSPRWGTVSPGAEGYFYCCVYCLLNEPPGGLVPFRGGEGTLSSRGCCARCVPGGEGWKFPLGTWLGSRHPSQPLERASVLLHLGC